MARGDFVLGGFWLGGFCPGGFCLGGFCPGGFCPGGFCPRTEIPIPPWGMSPYPVVCQSHLPPSISKRPLPSPLSPRPPPLLSLPPPCPALMMFGDARLIWRLTTLGAGHPCLDQYPVVNLLDGISPRTDHWRGGGGGREGVDPSHGQFIP